VPDVQRLAVGADPHAARPPAGWNVADEMPTRAGELDHANRVHAGFGDVEEVTVRTDRQSDGLHASERPILSAEQRQGDTAALFERSRVENRNAVVVPVGDVHATWADDYRVRMAAAVDIDSVLAIADER